jgi:succinate dehydrogenase/fumarate reductase-like Fe-S protein
VTGADQQRLTIKSARLRIWRGTNSKTGRYQEFDVEFEDGDSVLDALVRLRYGAAPDLAFTFSCFNANVCKECVMMIDGIIEYACIAKLKPGLTQLDPVPEQRILRDLMIDVRERDQKGLSLRHQMQTLSERKRCVKVRPRGSEPAQ